jgi:hypothetical protein
VNFKLDLEFKVETKFVGINYFRLLELPGKEIKYLNKYIKNLKNVIKIICINETFSSNIFMIDHFCDIFMKFNFNV